MVQLLEKYLNPDVQIDYAANFFTLQSKGFPCVHFLPCNLHVQSKGKSIIAHCSGLAGGQSISDDE